MMRSSLILESITLVLLASLVIADYYSTLGLERTCSEKEIKTAYRKLALQWHPDKNPGSDEAAAKFAAISTAHEVLSDPGKRATYDVHGEEGLKPQGQRGGSHNRGASSIFEAFGFGRPTPQKERTPNLEVPIRLTLSELYTGVSGLKLQYTRKTRCSRFAECARKCPGCAGQGVRVETRQVAPGFVQQVTVQDGACSGPDVCFQDRCPACPRGPLEQTPTTVRVAVAPGVRDGDRLVVAERGANEAPAFGGEERGSGEGVTPGDVVLVVRQLKHHVFERGSGGDDADTLFMDMKIPLVDALAGFNTTVMHLDGHPVLIEKRGVTSCGAKLRVAGEGMPRKKDPSHRGAAAATPAAAMASFGDLVVTFSVEFPSTLEGGEAQKEMLRNALLSWGEEKR